MATADEIAVKLGLNATEFKAALKSAGAEVNAFKEGTGGLSDALEHLNENTNRLQHRLLEGLFGYEALRRVVEWGAEAVKQAQEVRDEFEKLGRPIDTKTKLLADFGDALKDTKQLAVDGIGTVLSWFVKAGEGYGYLINRMRGISNEEQDLNEKTKRAADAQQKQTDDAIKKNAAAVEAAEKRLEEAREKALVERMTGEEKINALVEQRHKLMEEVNATGEHSVNGLAARLKLEENVTALGKARTEQDKQEEEARKKLVDLDYKAYEETKKAEKELHDLKFAALTPEKQLVQLAQEKLDIELKIQQQTAFGANTTAAQVELQKNINEQKKITDEITKSTAKTEAQITAEKIKQLTAEKNRLASIAGVRGGNQFNDASDATLQEIIRRNRSSSQILKATTSSQDIGNNLEIARLDSETANALKEIAFRNTFKQTVGLLGEEGARQRFGGDALQFDRVFQQLTSTQDKSTNLLQSLDDRLQTAGFGRRG